MASRQPCTALLTRLVCKTSSEHLQHVSDSPIRGKEVASSFPTTQYSKLCDATTSAMGTADSLRDPINSLTSLPSANPQPDDHQGEAGSSDRLSPGCVFGQSKPAWPSGSALPTVWHSRTQHVLTEFCKELFWV